MNDNEPLTRIQVEPAVPALLRLARRTYGEIIHEALANVGCGDMPRNGMYVIGGISRGGTRFEDLITQLGVSKQAASQLVNSLVVRDFIERVPDISDRRRMTVSLTERGKLAAEVAATMIDKINAQLVSVVGQESLERMKATLRALIVINVTRKSKELEIF